MLNDLEGIAPKEYISINYYLKNIQQPTKNQAERKAAGIGQI